jgi:vesicle-fusing ATPase
LKRPPPKGRKLLIIATTKYRDVLDQLDLLESFSTEINLPNMSSSKQILRVLNEIQHCFNEDEMKYLEQQLNDKK